MFVRINVEVLQQATTLQYSIKARAGQIAHRCIPLQQHQRFYHASVTANVHKLVTTRPLRLHLRAKRNDLPKCRAASVYSRQRQLRSAVAVRNI